MSENRKKPPPPEPDPQEPEDLLETGQEEVFSRAEVELGRIEHATSAGKKDRP